MRALRIEPLEQRQMLSITVNTAVDERDGRIDDGDISIRDAVEHAGNGETINFASSVSSISLLNGTNLGEILFSKSLTIDGGTAGVTIHAATGKRIFNITDATNGTNPPLVEMKRLTLTGGGTTVGSFEGGAIRSEGLLKLDATVISNNDAISGGGIFLAVAGGGSGDRRILDVSNNSRFEDNTATNAGGGVFVRFSTIGAAQDSVVFENASLRRNSANLGGALFIEGYGSSTNHSVTLAATVIDDNNTASIGGGIFHLSFSGVDLSVVNGSVISGNHATGQAGGGMYLTGSNGTQIRIANSTVSGNTSAGSGGGLRAYVDDSSSLLIEDSQITGNSSVKEGGGLHARTGRHDSTPHVRLVTIARSLISGNTAERAGGLYIHNYSGTEAMVEDCRITDNKAIATTHPKSGNGGGFYAYLSDNTDGVRKPRITISSSTVDDNEATRNGGGIFVCSKFNGEFHAINTTISDNRTLDTAIGLGGGVRVAVRNTDESVDAIFQNVTITKNTSASGGGVEIINGPDVRTRFTNSIISANVNHGGSPNNLNGNADAANSSHNFVGTGGNQGGLIGNSNILTNSNNPMLGPLVYNGGPVIEVDDVTRFVIPTHAPLPNSQVINMGDPSSVPGQNGVPLTDQRGDPWDRVAGGVVVGMNKIDIGAVEKQANPLPGDYNFNGVVDIADYTIWRPSFTSPPNTIDLRADGNDNGVIDVGDFTVWKGGFGSVLADASGNGATDVADYLIWAATEGSTVDLRADYNEDGIVDEADYEIWFDTFGSTVEVAQFGLLSNWFDPDAPPAVVGVALGLPGVQTMDFTGKVGSGEQVRSVPLIAANTLNVTFSRDVSVLYSNLQIVNLDGASPTVFDFDYDSLSQTATWTFNTSLANGRYLVRLSDSIESLDGKALDGEFTNPWSLGATGTSIFPSGDGDAGGEFRFRFTVLAGDTDHNNIHGAANYQNWQSTEPGMIIVSTTTDDFDGNLSFGDVSLREAIDYANTATSPTSIQLPTGRYVLTRSGTEGTGTANNDFDVLGDIAIFGAGPGLSIITPGSGFSPTYGDNRIFDVRGVAARLKLQGVTIANEMTYDQLLGAAALVQNQATLEIVDSAIVNNTGYGYGGGAVHSLGSHVTILRSVFTKNQGVQVGAVLSTSQGSNNGSLTIGDSIFALNIDSQGGYGSTPNVKATAGVVKINLGNNLYDDATGDFFDAVPAPGDYLGTPKYVVTTLADTFDHTNNAESLSIREAVDLANQAAGIQTIWIPAWKFTLTRDRGTNATDTNVSYGDLDIKNNLVIRGVAERTSIEWKSGVVDKVFDLLGDYSGDGEVDTYMPLYDWEVWDSQYFQSGAWEQFAADGDDDGDVDVYDEDIWAQNLGHTLQLFNLSA